LLYAICKAIKRIQITEISDIERTLILLTQPKSLGVVFQNYHSRLTHKLLLLKILESAGNAFVDCHNHILFVYVHPSEQLTDEVAEHLLTVWRTNPGEIRARPLKHDFLEDCGNPSRG
jgi:hypothetical protein